MKTRLGPGSSRLRVQLSMFNALLSDSQAAEGSRFTLSRMTEIAIDFSVGGSGKRQARDQAINRERRDHMRFHINPRVK